MSHNHVHPQGLSHPPLQQHHDHHGHDSVGNPSEPQSYADFTEKNRQYFDNLATSYSVEDWQKELIGYTGEQLLGHLDWMGVDWLKPSEMGANEREVRILDYACGPGTVSAVLAPYATTLLGVDISPNMVNEYNKRFTDTPPPNQPSIHAIVADLISPEAAPEVDPAFQNFDLAVVGYGFHHFSMPGPSLSRLASHVKPGTGAVMIIDFLPFDSGFSAKHQAGHTISHHGFNEDDMRALFEEAGCHDVQFTVLDRELPLGGINKRRGVFFARGIKNGE